ncbi:MAG: PrsW family intramembrane metalloprotease [Planctomycetota bacterium]
MALIYSLLVAFVPSALWLWIFYRKDRWEPEPKRLVIRVFLLGALAAGPVFLLEYHLRMPGTVLHEFFIRVALVEEVFKVLPVLWLAWRSREFNEPMDGMMYAISAALGFAAAENAVYAMQAGNLLAIVRAFTTTLVHVSLSGLVGYAIGLARFGRPYRTVIVVATFAAAVTLHGAFNLFVAMSALPEMPEWVARVAVAILLPSMLILFAAAMRRADRMSPYRRARRNQASGSGSSETSSMNPATTERSTPQMSRATRM